MLGNESGAGGYGVIPAQAGTRKLQSWYVQNYWDGRIAEFIDSGTSPE